MPDLSCCVCARADGCSLGVQLYFRVLREGVCIFLLMFLLCVPALMENRSRALLRHSCRVVASTSAGYALLTQGVGAPNLTAAEMLAAVEGSALGPPAAAVAACGYANQTIRPFFDPGRAGKLDRYVNPERDIYGLRWAMGACGEFADASYRPGLNARIHDFPTLSSEPFIVPTPHAYYCLGSEGGSSIGTVLHLLALLVFALWLKLKLRYDIVRLAELDDRQLVTTADFALMLEGLDNVGRTADELKAALTDELEGLEGGYYKGKIHHLEVGRGCKAELRAMQGLEALDMRAEELASKLEAKRAAKMSDATEMRALRGLATEYTALVRRVQELVDEEDKATGHAFVAFHHEADRDRMARLLILGPSGGGKEGGEPPVLNCAAPRAANAPWIERWRAKLTGQGAPKPASPLVVKSAPEPEEILWGNLQSDAASERQVKFVGGLMTALLMLLGMGMLASVKTITLTIENWTVVVRPSGGLVGLLNVLAACAIGAVTVGFNFLFKRMAVSVSKREGHDTRTLEEAAIFHKLSFSFLFNSVLVPVVLGGFITLRSSGRAIDPTWFEQGGVVAQAFVLMIFNCITDLSRVFDPSAYLRHHLVFPFEAYSQAKAERIMSPPKFHIGLHYAFASKIFALGLVFGPIFPFAFLITSIGLAFRWLSAKLDLKYKSKRPVSVNHGMLMQLRIDLCAFSLFGVLVWCMATASAMATDAAQGTQSLLAFVGGPIIILFLWLMPLPCAAFQLSGQINVGRKSGDANQGLQMVAAIEYGLGAVASRLSHQDVDKAGNPDQGDTGGLAFDEVVHVKGFDMDHYVCPRLGSDTLDQMRREASATGDEVLTESPPQTPSPKVAGNLDEKSAESPSRVRRRSRTAGEAMVIHGQRTAKVLKKYGCEINHDHGVHEHSPSSTATSSARGVDMNVSASTAEPEHVALEVGEE